VTFSPFLRNARSTTLREQEEISKVSGRATAGTRSQPPHPKAWKAGTTSALGDTHGNLASAKPFRSLFLSAERWISYPHNLAEPHKVEPTWNPIAPYVHLYVPDNKKPYKNGIPVVTSTESKVPIWITTAPLLESQYPRNTCAGWDTGMAPFNVFGWNPCHSTICLDGLTKGCLGPDADHKVVIPWDRDMQEVCEIGWNDIRKNKKWVFPADKEQLRDLIGTLWSHNAVTHNCHHFVSEQGYPLW
jgi:hypothetical protein